MAKYELKVAESREEIKQYEEVRRAVFVNEQGIFNEDDSDDYDTIAVPIIAVEAESGRVAGVVRCYPIENGDWVGGRLAVLPEFRGRLGALLVRKAMEEVQGRGCRIFYAHIQEQNVKFFERLGWSLTGKSSVFSNVVHYDMKVVF
ncbi:MULTISPECIES: MSMEG_0567/Sll0786 family nitrogen starvation N-acetyltransferase [Desulfitobacterium]|uniref:Putative N-acetyltransferase, MSMEG_0567 N-terminal domain family n=1 Tax=Desulfitobacterium dehalogenans (strain ATCC 51507 / DSM 9161 / JW/IU-DC1) TaxID=756499 RepID=I4A5I8_DESDJ|nr:MULTISPECIES: MSMEG_0567/Sll0786 family nitrogen starvation N-acetyltransferase [Desulfitobacterium]AFL99222.1 putative N-acetyltransferase, MSMEG_0567 N-terminal domain family [Desulfitobacterium dehalogenans ATCC 51507]